MVKYTRDPMRSIDAISVEFKALLGRESVRFQARLSFEEGNFKPRVNNDCLKPKD